MSQFDENLFTDPCDDVEWQDAYVRGALGSYLADAAPAAFAKEQLLERIHVEAAGSEARKPRPVRVPEPRPAMMHVLRLAFAGALAVVAALAFNGTALAPYRLGHGQVAAAQLATAQATPDCLYAHGDQCLKPDIQEVADSSLPPKVQEL